ncbi:MAG: hypothetical protein KDE27_03485 [Planctomycetes bacterium]|nr:hypothetical protein [Planctomycetota bacterium]
MRTLLAGAVLAGPLSLLSAQAPEAPVALMIDDGPPLAGDSSEGHWLDAPGLEGSVLPVTAFRIRGDHVEGGWIRPVADVVVFEPGHGWLEGYEWLDGGHSVQTSALDRHGAVLAGTDHKVYREHTAQQMVDLALTNPQGLPYSLAVRDWCQPLLTEVAGAGYLPSRRIWRIDSPLWTPGTIGEIHQRLWLDLLRDDPDQPNRSFTALSGGAMLRRAIVMQSYYMHEGDIGPATAFLNSDSFTAAVDSGLIGISLQLIAVRAAALPDPEVTFAGDGDVPGVGFETAPPKLSPSKVGKLIILYPHEADDGCYGFDGQQLVPGARFYFTLQYGTYPVTVRFPTTSGTVDKPAAAVPNEANPSRYAVYVPNDLANGVVFLKTGLATTFRAVGHVSVAPQGGGE